MFPIITPQMLNLPDSVQAASLTRLPWPDGSIVSARLMASGIPGTALLILGSYRLLAEVPPTVPMGEIWMQLINREIPASFRLLSDNQALLLLAGMLESEQTDVPRPQSTRNRNLFQAGEDAKKTAGERPEWPHLSNPSRQDGKGGLPWHGETTPDGQSLLWYDNNDEQPRGLLRKRVEQHHFVLSGRVDMDHLGAFAFALEGELPGQAQKKPILGWKLQLHAGRDEHIGQLRSSFTDWLQQQNVCFPGITGRLEAGLPEIRQGGLSERMA